MTSDIKLDGDFTVVEGIALLSKTYDIMLDAPTRRVKPDGLRRALVHSSEDGLIVNFDEDYPGGVTIAGKTNVATISAKSNLEINPPNTAQPPSQSSNLEVVEELPKNPWRNDFDRLFVDIFAEIEKSTDKPTTNLAAEIRRLRQAVLELNERLKRLENS